MHVINIVHQRHESHRKMSTPHASFCRRLEEVYVHFEQQRNQYAVSHETQYAYDQLETDLRALLRLRRLRCQMK